VLSVNIAYLGLGRVSMRHDALMDAVAIAVAVLAHEWGDDDLALHR
jgi:hypothetical protein